MATSGFLLDAITVRWAILRGHFSEYDFKPFDPHT